jgi:hypothetical protein
MHIIRYPIRTLVFLLSFVATASAFAQSGPGDAVRVLVADNPSECLSLETIFIEDNGYALVDGRNNTGRVKFISSSGEVLKACVSTVPLPDAASLPGDILPSPFGLDRVIVGPDKIWVTPAPWARSAAEVFDRVTGSFLERMPGTGQNTNGLLGDSDGHVWAVMRQSMLDLSDPNHQYLDLAGAIDHIDCATGHPMGFIILAQPEIALVEKTGVVRWRLSLSGLLDGFLSPIDIAAGSDGTVAILAVLCDTGGQDTVDEYFSFREQCLQYNDEDTLYGIEDALRSHFTAGYVLLIINPDGTFSEYVDLSDPPVACDVDSTGRIHIVTQESQGWAISIIDPRIDEGLPQCVIPYGLPTLISPHRLASGPDGSLYWDDIRPTETGNNWGIAKLAPSSGLFSLGDGDSSITWVHEEPMEDSIRIGTALLCGSEGEIRAGCQDFAWDISTTQSEDALNSAYISSVVYVSDDGVLLRRDPVPDILGPASVLCELFSTSEKIYGIWAGSDTGFSVGTIAQDGTWTPGADFQPGGTVSNARVGRIVNGFIAWFSSFNGDTDEPLWYTLDPSFQNAREITKLNAARCRLLDSSPQSNEFYATIDDGEVFRIDAGTLAVNGIWSNRLPGGAPGHPLDDAECCSGGLAILDREHRAIFSVSPEAFTQPPLASEEEVETAISSITTALEDYHYTNGTYPVPSSRLLIDLLEMSDLNTIEQCFIGGRVYNYQPTETGYSFIVWSAAADQPVLICTPSGNETVY